MGAQRVVIDSLSGFEMAVSPGFREDFPESIYRLVGLLTGFGITVMMTLEVEDSYTELRLGPRENGFLADAIILQRFVEIDGQLQRIIGVAKVRASEHSKDLRLYEIGLQGSPRGGVAHALSRIADGPSNEARGAQAARARIPLSAGEF